MIRNLSRLSFFLLLVVTGCTSLSDNEDKTELARVNEHYLYLEDVEDVLDLGRSGRDSITMIQNFVSKWVQQQVIIDQARQNLLEEELDFSKQLEEYRNSLIIYSYETRLLEQYLDTAVTSPEIEEYYRQNPNNFELSENIIQINYVRLHVDSPEVNRIRSLLRSDDTEQLYLLEEYCERYATEFWLEDEWLYFNDILEQLPTEMDDQENFLARNKNIQLKEDPFWYLVHIKDYKLRDSISPLEMERENIKKIIVNKRKLDLIKKMREDLVKAAVENNQVEIY